MAMEIYPNTILSLFVCIQNQSLLIACDYIIHNDLFFIVTNLHDFFLLHLKFSLRLKNRGKIEFLLLKYRRLETYAKP